LTPAEPQHSSSARTLDAGMIEPDDVTRHGPPKFCERPGDDAVRDVFCVHTRPEITSLEDLMSLVKANVASNPEDRDAGRGPATSLGTVRYVAVLGHSTALSGHVVSPINPRAIVMGKGTLLAYQRGVQRVELASFTRDGTGLHFYVVTFKQACNAKKRGCNAGDLYTPKIEANWSSYAIADEEDVKDTPLDCRQCHQRGRERNTLLMRELESPWTHFFFSPTTDIRIPGVNGVDLANDYLAAKGDELYGGFAVRNVSIVASFVLQTTVDPHQPLYFNAPQILQERYPFGPDGYPADPLPSPTWEAGYAAWKRGEQLALPYLESRATDPDKQAQLTAAYRAYLDGALDADDLPDLADIFPNDPLTRARIGLQTEPGASPVDTLIQGCGSCHNDVLDQSISRARFNVDVARLDAAERQLAAERVQRPRGMPGAMPPPEARQLDPDARDRLVEYLLSDAPVREPDPRLAHAASLGMKGGDGTGRYQ
jgi:hypothetical protein